MSQQNPVAVVAKKNELRHMIETSDFKNAVAKALPKHLTPDRFVRVACTAMLKTPKLAQCDRASFINSLLTLSQLGLEPDGRLAHLIPFENRKFGRVDCQLIIDYKGLVELALRSGAYTAIHADKICENDEFEYDRGQIVKHKINFKQPRGEAYAYYAMATPKEGDPKCEVMPRQDIDAIRSRSRAGNSGPWVTDYDEMAKKTVFRRLSKWLRSSPELRDAIDADDDTVVGGAASNEAVSILDIPAANVPEVTKDDLAAPAEQSADIVPMPTAPAAEDDVPYDSPQAAPAPAPAKPAIKPTRKANQPLPTAPAPVPAPAPEPEQVQTEQAPANTITPQMVLENIVKGAGFTLEQFCSVAIGLGMLESPVASYSELSNETAARFVRSEKGLITNLNLTKAGSPA